MEVIKDWLVDLLGLVCLSGLLFWLTIKSFELMEKMLNRLLLMLEIKVAFLQFIRNRYRCSCGALTPSKLENHIDRTRKQLE